MGDCAHCGAKGTVWDDNLYWGCTNCQAGNILTPNHRPVNSSPAPSRCICLPELLPAVAVNCRAEHVCPPVPTADTEAP
jgi:hypothetical protein